ncbi:MAG: hypothetical protein K2K97_09235, partial [Muribaculaceae bacterium]|nr:hypothetical protein [Muribaculaceae bacterium]
HEPKILKAKTTPRPDEEAFLNWLEEEYKMDYETALKIVSSVKNMELIVPSRVTEFSSFLEVLRRLPKDKRDSYLKFVKQKKNRIFERANCKPKTVQNGFTNVGFYIKFLNSKDQ